jgi:hypothetical protein
MLSQATSIWDSRQEDKARLALVARFLRELDGKLDVPDGGG